MFWATKTFTWMPLLCASAALLLMAATIWFRWSEANTSSTQSTDGALRAYRWSLAAGVVVGFAQLPLLAQAWRAPSFRPLVMPFIEMAVLAAALSAVVLFARRRGIILASFAILLVLHGLMGLWYLRLSSNPRIDVYFIQQLGCDALVHGHDPYAITFPNIYGPRQAYYPPDSVVNGVVQCGYFYPPLSLVLDVPGFLLGDVRYSLWAALEVTFALLALGVPRRRGVVFDLGPVVLLMFLPGIFTLMENAWIEPMLLLMLAIAAIASLRRKWILSAVAIGLMLSGKQYAVMAAPAVLLLLPQPLQRSTVLRWGAVIVAAALAITLPFLLWSPTAFFHSLISIYVGILRPDSITYLPILSTLMHRRLSLGATIVFALPAAALVLWRGPRTVAGFSLGVAFIFVCTFLFSTQSFGNYYFLVAGALCVSLVTRQPNQPPQSSKV